MRLEMMSVSAPSVGEALHHPFILALKKENAGHHLLLGEGISARFCCRILTLAESLHAFFCCRCGFLRD